MVGLAADIDLPIGLRDVEVVVENKVVAAARGMSTEEQKDRLIFRRRWVDVFQRLHVASLKRRRDPDAVQRVRAEGGVRLLPQPDPRCELRGDRVDQRIALADGSSRQLGQGGFWTRSALRSPTTQMHDRRVGRTCLLVGFPLGASSGGEEDRDQDGCCRIPPAVGRSWICWDNH